MKKKSIINCFHYGVKYLLIALPIIFMLIAFIIPKNQILFVNYKYETNEVNSVNDLVVGNIYHFKLSKPNDFLSIGEFHDAYNILAYQTSITELTNFDECYFNSVYNVIYFRFGGNFYTADFQDKEYLEMDLVYTSGYVNPNLIQYFSKCENIPIESISNNGLDERLYSWLDSFSNIPLNSFYNDLATTIGFGNLDTHTPLGFVYYMPLWIMWIYIFDLVLDFMIFIPKIAHKWLSKGYGEE